jgi:hypothetical protein
VPMILDLIDSLVDDQHLENNDENLLVTIDSLISSLKDLRDKIQVIRHDDIHPLNLTKPKVKQQGIRSSSNNADEQHTLAHSSMTSNLSIPASLFASHQPYFSPFSGKHE